MNKHPLVDKSRWSVYDAHGNTFLTEQGETVYLSLQDIRDIADFFKWTGTTGYIEWLKRNRGIE